MVPHQHPKHVDPPNQTHLKHNILELMYSDIFLSFLNFYQCNLITLIFPLFLKQWPKANGKSHFTRHHYEIDFVVLF